MFRIATKDDLPVILKIYEEARKFMASYGNGGQWGTSYPEEELLIENIKKKELYVYLDPDSKHIRGVFAFIIGPDPSYEVIEDGSWISGTTYGTIHRIASARQERGFFKKALSYCESILPHIRIDTHEKNHIMRHLVLKNGFSQCGIIYVEDGTLRIAFEKLS